MWALVALSAQFLPTLHALTGAHEICTIHGDVVEAGHDTSTTLHAHAAPDASLTATSDAEADAHGHCDLLGVVGREPHPPTATSVLPCLVFADAHLAFAAGEFVPSPIALDALAPNLPPPVPG